MAQDTKGQDRKGQDRKRQTVKAQNKQVYDVVVIGAGSAGLSAIAEIEKITKNFLLVNHGIGGTTCARVGCMPSKTLIKIANDFHSRNSFSETGILGSKNLKVNSVAVMKYVRKLRDRFVRGVSAELAQLKDKNVQGFAKFLDVNTLKVNNQIIRAKKIIVATGSTPEFPENWKPFSDRIVTTDELFEMDEFPRSLIALGMGPIGLEMGQALSRLGVHVTGIGSNKFLANLSDPVVNNFAKTVFESEFASLELGKEANIVSDRRGLKAILGNKVFRGDKVLASLGRKPNLEGLQLKEIGVKFDKNKIPIFDKETLRLPGLSIFLAGDVSNYRPVLHEAIDEGRIAGFNSGRRNPQAFKRRVPLTITFCEPNIATVGLRFSELDGGPGGAGHDTIIGEARLNFGRAIILSQEGLLRIYASSPKGTLLGAEMIAPHGEHLAHLIAVMIQQKMTVFDALKVPFYHPVMEEGLREALRELSKKLPQRKVRFDLEAR